MRIKDRNPDLFDPGSGIRGGKIWIRYKHPGSARLFFFFELLEGFIISRRRSLESSRSDHPALQNMIFFNLFIF